MFSESRIGYLGKDFLNLMEILLRTATQLGRKIGASLIEENSCIKIECG